MRLVLTPEEKAIYLDLLEDLLNADTEYEIKSIEFNILNFLNNIKDFRKNVEDFDEKAATAQFVRAGKLKS
ncbi:MULTISPECIES: hypothetical protein [unclassified Bacillus (in: firmicutes)]|uniref:hypothetical protein n=1 Tax=unclassified Bacillus (in: firmicutes) TaxID=185979 RepID=UPI000BF00B2D|nr:MULTISPECIES: hypothetical protein [unclassified Bacillus (in: firmicutes)]PEJ47600.1 hypothetical protein CN692_24890 [Bacillus sp. AFS002410]PEL14099.1 hypothetical protein CN601_00705 [Bacillus sp. AFS017336]